MPEIERDRVALLDLDGSLADYDTSMREQMQALQGPGETPYGYRYPDGEEPPYLMQRRKLIQRQTGFWRNLKRLEPGFVLVDEMRKIGFTLHTLTKGPAGAPNAWSEKLEWSQKELPDAAVTLAGDKSLVYGRVLYDDFPTYFEGWLTYRPRGLVICLAQPWNEEYRVGGNKEHPNVLRYDGSNLAAASERLWQAFNRELGI